MSGRKITLGLVVRNEASQIIECLENLYLIAGTDLCELIVVDNVSNDSTVSLIEDWSAVNHSVPIKILHSAENNMAIARNEILNSAVSEWVYFTDADCRLIPASWGKVLSVLNSTDTGSLIAAFGGGNITPVTGSFVSQGLHQLSRNPLGHMGAIQATNPSDAQPTKFLSSCNLLVNVPKAKQCGGFDERYARVGEDLTLCHRLRQAGFALYSVPGMEVIHLQDRGLKMWLRKMCRYGEGQVQVACNYSTHFKGFRGVQFFACWLFLILLAFVPEVALTILSIYVASVLALSKATPGNIFKGTVFIFLSHAAYAIGELSATLTLPIFVFTSLPAKIPALEKQ